LGTSALGALHLPAFLANLAKVGGSHPSLPCLFYFQSFLPCHTFVFVTISVILGVQGQKARDTNWK